MTDIPHFALPFQFQPGAQNTGGSQAVVTEQDSVDEIAYCAYAALICPQGFRVELPEFGLPDPTFSWPVDVDLIRETVTEWEPRAALAFSDAELKLIAQGQTP